MSIGKWLILLVLAGAAAMTPVAGCSSEPALRERLIGHWSVGETRELHVGGDSLTWVFGDNPVTFDYEVVTEDAAARRLELRIVGLDGVLYRIDFAADFQSGTFVEPEGDRPSAPITRIGDSREPPAPEDDPA
jgi:hypothetical protein